MTKEFRMALYRFMYWYMMKSKRESIESFADLSKIQW